jgi:hypothetical protein
MAKKEKVTLQELIVQTPELKSSLLKFENVKLQLDKAAETCLQIKVTDENSLAVCENQMGKVNELIKAVESVRVAEKKPHFERGKAVDAAAAYVSESSEEALKHLKNEKIAWIRLKDAERKAKEEELAAMAEIGIEPVFEEAPIEIEVISKVRRPWTFEVVDINSVPKEFLMVDESKVKEYLKSNSDSLEDGKVVNGIKYYKDLKVTV